MKKLYLFMIALLVTAMSFGQAVEIIHETFGSGGYWKGSMSDNPNLTSVAMFSDDVAVTQSWNAGGQGYDGASKGFHVILREDGDSDSDTVRFSIPTVGFTGITFKLGVFSWGAVGGQFEFEYSSDGTTWTKFDETALVTGDQFGAGWQLFTFSEDLPAVDALHIKCYRENPSNQVHCDDLVVEGVPTADNALLSTVGLDVGNIDFAYYTNDYEVWVPYGTTATPVITAETFSASASIAVTDAADITSATDADRTSTVVVTAEDGTTQNTYTIEFNVTPPREDASLDDIELSYATLAPGFNSAILRYLVDLPDTATMAPVITPVLSDTEAGTFVITGPTDIAAADAADRTAFIEVTAQDGVTKLTYEVVFKVGGGSTDLFISDVETFGDEGNKFGITLNEYAGFTSNWIWGSQTVNTRALSPSTGYDNASGANNIEVQAGWGAGYDTLVFQANTSQISNVTLASGIYNNSGADVGASVAFKAYYSTDSVAWTSIGNETQLGTAFPLANSWSYVILDDVLPTDDTLYVMFANEDANFEYKLDDIALWGTPLNTNNQLASLTLSEGTLDPAFDPNVTSYTVALPQGSSTTPTVDYSVLSPSATVDVADAADIRSLDVADNTTTITVTAENGAVKTYEIVFDVFMSDDATLKELTIGEGLPLSPSFSNDVMGYAVKLPAGTVDAPTITATPESDFATVDISGPADINSQDVADRTATIVVTAEDMVTIKTFQIVYTFGSLADVRFNFFQEMFSETGTFEAEDYTGYTSGAMFDGDEHKWDNRNTAEYPLASNGAAIKFGEWGAEPTYVELVMKQIISGYENIRVSFGLEHNSNGWGDNGCGLTNNFVGVEYTLDSTTWTAMDVDSLTEYSADYPCGGDPMGFVDLGEEVPVNDAGYVIIRFTHTDGTLHPFYLDDIVLSGSPISADATLFDLTVSEGDLDPGFAQLTYSYAVELPYGTTATPTLTPTASETEATVDVTDAADVTSGDAADRTSTITVTAPDGMTQQVYTVVFSVAPNNDATLSDLTVGEGELDADFSATTFDYTVELPGTRTSNDPPSVTATATDANASVQVNDAADVLSTSTTDKTTTVVVTAEDGTTQLTYSILWDVRVSKADIEAGQFTIYPNPASEMLYINNADAIKSVAITNLAGQVMKEVQGNSNGSLEIDLNGLEQGYYLIKIQSIDRQTISKGFIKE